MNRRVFNPTKQMFCCRDYTPFEGSPLSEDEIERVVSCLPKQIYHVSFSATYEHMSGDYWNPPYVQFDPILSNDDNILKDIASISDEECRKLLDEDFEIWCESIVGDPRLFEEDF